MPKLFLWDRPNHMLQSQHRISSLTQNDLCKIHRNWECPSSSVLLQERTATLQSALLNVYYYSLRHTSVWSVWRGRGTACVGVQLQLYSTNNDSLLGCCVLMGETASVPAWLVNMHHFCWNGLCRGQRADQEGRRGGGSGSV